MLKARWTQFGPPSTPRVIFVRGIGEVRVTQEDIDRYGDISGDPEVICEHVDGDSEATHRITGLAPETPGVHDELAARDSSAAHPQRDERGSPRRSARHRSWLDVLLGR